MNAPRAALPALAASLLASVLWGLSTVYYAHVESPPLEVAAHRVVWGFLFIAVYCLATGRRGAIRAALCEWAAFRRLIFSAMFIAINWATFIAAIHGRKTIEASLGYFMLPIIAAFMGAVLLGERLTRRQWLAIAISASGGAVLAIGSGTTPWVALIVATSFAIYGMIHKTGRTGAVTSICIESMLLLPIALLWIAGAHRYGWLGIGSVHSPGAFGRDAQVTMLLAGSGVITFIPLALYAFASRHMRYATLGQLFYVNPTLQLLAAHFLLGEAVTRWHAIAFLCIWTGLGLYSTARAALTAGECPAPNKRSSAPSVSSAPERAVKVRR